MSVIPESDLKELYDRWNIYPYDLKELLRSLLSYNLGYNNDGLETIRKYYSTMDIQLCLSQFNLHFSFYNRYRVNAFPELLLTMEPAILYHYLYHETRYEIYDNFRDEIYFLAAIISLKKISPEACSEIVNNLIAYIESIEYDDKFHDNSLYKNIDKCLSRKLQSLLS